MNPGKYKGKAIGGKFFQAKSGSAGVNVDFVVTEGDQAGKTVQWTGWLTEKARESAIETMIKMGYDENLPLVNGEFGEMNLSGKEMELVVQMEPSQKDPTKSFPRVRYVNELGGSKFAGTNPEQMNLGFDLKGAFKNERAKLGVSAPAPKDPHEGDLPF